MRVSVHICTKNRAGELFGCLVSLWNQTFTDWDLILVDSGQDVRSWKMVFDILMRFKLDGHGVKYLRDDSGKGIGRSRNIAIENDDWNDLCVRVDDDSVMDKDYIENLQCAYDCLEVECDAQLHKLNRKIGAIGGVVPLLGQPKIYRYLPKIFNEFKYNETGEDVVIEDDGGCHFYEGREVMGLTESHHLRSSFLFNKKAAIEVGMHPENLGSSGFREETDFCARLLVGGYKLYTTPLAICWHVQAQSGGVRIDRGEYIKQVNNNTEWLTERLIKWHKEKKL